MEEKTVKIPEIHYFFINQQLLFESLHIFLPQIQGRSPISFPSTHWSKRLYAKALHMRGGDRGKYEGHVLIRTLSTY